MKQCTHACLLQWTKGKSHNLVLYITIWFSHVLFLMLYSWVFKYVDEFLSFNETWTNNKRQFRFKWNKLLNRVQSPFAILFSTFYKVNPFFSCLLSLLFYWDEIWTLTRRYLTKIFRSSPCIRVSHTDSSISGIEILSYVANFKQIWTTTWAPFSKSSHHTKVK